MPSGDDIIREHRRLAILKLLKQDPEYSLNESILRDLLTEFRFTVTRDQVRADLAWLQAVALVRAREIGGAILVADLTELGAEVADGRASCPGVKRPAPKAV